MSHGSPTDKDAVCSCFIPANYRDTYPSEAAALKATRLDAALLARMQVMPLVGGGRLFQEMHAAFVIVPSRTGGFELWLSGTGLFCASRAEALAAVAEFETSEEKSHGEGDWQVFALE